MMYALEFVNGWNDGQDSSPCSAEIILSRPHIQALDFSVIPTTPLFEAWEPFPCFRLVFPRRDTPNLQGQPHR